MVSKAFTNIAAAARTAQSGGREEETEGEREKEREKERKKERKKKEIEIRKNKKSEECNHAQGCSRIFDDGPLTVLSQEKNGDKREKDYFYTVKPGLCASAVKRLVNSPNE